MHSPWKRFDSLLIPLVVCDHGGTILYKNDPAREMDLLRMGSKIKSKMDALNSERFANLTKKGAILTVFGKLNAYRALSFPFGKDDGSYIALFFPEALLGMQKNTEVEHLLLEMVPSLREMMVTSYPLPPMLDRNAGQKAASVRMVTLMRKMMDLYLSEDRKHEDLPSDITYFLSVLTYYFRAIYKQMGVEIAIAEGVAECGFIFYDHRDLTALFISMIQLILDRSGSDRMYIDIDSEGGEAVVKFCATLKQEWVMPDKELPDSFILFELLRKKGIDYEFYTDIEEDTPRMVCRMFLPLRLAAPSLELRSTAKMDFERIVSDFLFYLAV